MMVKLSLWIVWLIHRQKKKSSIIGVIFIKTAMKAEVDEKMSDGYDERLNALHPLGMGNPEDIANGIVYLLSDMSKWVTGITLSIDGGFTAQ